MNKTKKILIIAFGVLFALSSCNSKHDLENHCIDGSCGHACELDSCEEHEHNNYCEECDYDEHESINIKEVNLGNEKLGISVLSKKNVGINHEYLTFHVGDNEGFGSIELQANYQPVGCLKDSIWSVGDSNILSAIPNSNDSSICVIKALQEFEGFVTISVKSKYFSDINATLKATYSGGFKIEVISGTISLNATRKCVHEGTSISESSNSKSNLSNYFKVKYNGSYLSNFEIYNFINSGDLIVNTTGDLNFVNNSSAPYFVMKDLSSSSSSGSKTIGATLKDKNDDSISGSISGTSVMNIGSWSKSSGSRQVSSTCYGTIKKYSSTSYSYYCDTCGASDNSWNYGDTCGRNTTSYYYSCNSCGTSYSSTGTCSKSSLQECGSTNISKDEVGYNQFRYYCNICKSEVSEQDYETYGICTNMRSKTCGGSITRKSSSSSCSGTITRRSSTSYYYKCSLCDRSGSSSENGSTCLKSTTINQTYYYCSVCRKEL